jgi:hypothetical protein
VQEQVFEGISSARLKSYAVWEPILRTDDVRGARKATTLLPDRRVRHYWVEGQDVGVMFEPALGLRETAWDVYLVYAPGITWNGKTPPKPAYYMHQLHSLPAARMLKPETLAAKVRETLSR